MQKVKNHNLNLSRVSEQVLSSILDYMESQNIHSSQKKSSAFLSSGSFLKESEMPRAGFEPMTYGDVTRNTNFPFSFCVQIKGGKGYSNNRIDDEVWNRYKKSWALMGVRDHKKLVAATRFAKFANPMPSSLEKCVLNKVRKI